MESLTPTVLPTISKERRSGSTIARAALAMLICGRAPLPSMQRLRISVHDCSRTDIVYRKGERPIEKKVVDYSPDHPVASAIADGDHWMDAWLGQMCTPRAEIKRKTGITEDRIEALTYDDVMPTPTEIEALANLWYVTPEGLMESICNGQRRERAHPDQ